VSQGLRQCKGNCIAMWFGWKVTIIVTIHDVMLGVSVSLCSLPPVIKHALTQVILRCQGGFSSSCQVPLGHFTPCSCFSCA